MKEIDKFVSIIYGKSQILVQKKKKKEMQEELRERKDENIVPFGGITLVAGQLKVILCFNIGKPRAGLSLSLWISQEKVYNLVNARCSIPFASAS